MELLIVEWSDSIDLYFNTETEISTNASFIDIMVDNVNVLKKENLETFEGVYYSVEGDENIIKFFFNLQKALPCNCKVTFI